MWEYVQKHEYPSMRLSFSKWKKVRLEEKYSFYLIVSPLVLLSHIIIIYQREIIETAWTSLGHLQRNHESNPFLCLLALLPGPRPTTRLMWIDKNEKQESFHA